MALAGMDPLVFYYTKDPEEQEFMKATAQAYLELRDRMDRNLATHIANAVWGGLKRGG